MPTKRKIQIQDSKTKDLLFPKTYAELVQGIEDYSKNTHNHTFTGTSKAVSVSGNYDKAGGVTINPITPSGNVKLTRSKDVAASTLSINQVKTNGTLPTTEDKTVVTSATNVTGASFTGNKVAITTESGTATYTPAGSVSQPSFNGSVNLGSNTVSASGVQYLEDVTISTGSLAGTTEYLHYTPGAVPTRAQVSVVTGVTGGTGSRDLQYLHYTAPTSTGSQTFITGISGGSGNLTASVATSGAGETARSTLTLNHTHTAASASGSAAAITGISTGSLTANATAAGGIQVVKEATFTPASASTSNIYQITGVGSAGSLTKDSVATGGIAYISSISGGSSSLTKTFKYFHPTVTGSVTQPTFTGTGVRLVTTPTGTISLSTVSAPTEVVKSVTSVGTLPSIEQVNVVTGISTQPEFTAAFTGNQINITGSVSTVSTPLTLTGSYLPEGAISAAVSA